LFFFITLTDKNGKRMIIILMIYELNKNCEQLTVFKNFVIILTT